VLCKENGLHSGSDYYFFTITPEAEKLLYYITSVGEFCADYGYRVEREDYHNYMCYYVLEGNLSVTSGDVTKVAKKGACGFINCHKPHEYHAVGYTKFLWVHFDGANTNAFHEEVLERNEGFMVNNGSIERVRKTIAEIVECCRDEREISSSDASRWVYEILLSLLGKAPVRGMEEHDSSIVESVRYIKAHYADPIQLQDIADSIGMSVYHFSRLFKKEMGYTPHEYLVSERINAAKYLLKTTDLSNKTIAFNVGYQNESNFVSSFSAKVGISPGKFRKYPI